jgi:O-acetyl-ADP-ribose deacetylase
MTGEIPRPHITIVRAQLGQQAVDAIVNGAPDISKLADGAHAFIWQWDRRQRKELDSLVRGHGLTAGKAVAGSGGKLPARWVIHTIYPASINSDQDAGLLASCYREAMAVAAGLGARSIGFAKMLWPDPRYAEARRQAAWTAVSSAMRAPFPLAQVVFASPDPDMVQVYTGVWEILSRS